MRSRLNENTVEDLKFLRCGMRAELISNLRIWNSLPLHLRSFTISREQFRARLKTYLFKCAYTRFTSENYLGVSLLTYLLLTNQ